VPEQDTGACDGATWQWWPWREPDSTSPPNEIEVNGTDEEAAPVVTFYGAYQEKRDGTGAEVSMLVENAETGDLESQSGYAYPV